MAYNKKSFFNTHETFKQRKLSVPETDRRARRKRVRDIIVQLQWN